jgi:GNAT superfamily N-acetyltransferase
MPQSETMSIILREIESADAEAAAKLSAEFGYPVDPAVMKQRIQSLARESQTVIVACQRGNVVGWIDVGLVVHLQSGESAEIGGLVVSETCRNQGIGGQLVSAAERWAQGRGVGRVLVRSQIAREAAHRFYLRQGYERTKTSAVFVKALR